MICFHLYIPMRWKKFVYKAVYGIWKSRANSRSRNFCRIPVRYFVFFRRCFFVFEHIVGSLEVVVFARSEERTLIIASYTRSQQCVAALITRATFVVFIVPAQNRDTGWGGVRKSSMMKHFIAPIRKEECDLSYVTYISSPLCAPVCIIDAHATDTHSR